MTEVSWIQAGVERHAAWLSVGLIKPPARIDVVDDTCSADRAYRAMCEGTSLLWQGDYQNARQLLAAVGRRLDRALGAKPAAAPMGLDTIYHRYRQSQAQRASVLNKLLVYLDKDYAVQLRRAPDARAALTQTHGRCDDASLMPLRELQGVIGAFQWRLKGVHVAAIDQKIHPHYGVFSPVRGEYIDLVARAALPVGRKLAFDVGCGTGVLAAVLARRGFERVIASDLEPRAVTCATDTINMLGLSDRVKILQCDLYPPGRADLIVCNPPWMPGRASSSLDSAIHDPDSRMLRGILAQADAHLAPQGQLWLVLSDLAEHLLLRRREDLLALIDAAGLIIIGRDDVHASHPRANDPNDPLQAARRAETTSLWRLARAI